MTDQRIPSQWQLQNTGEDVEPWMLHDDEQRLPNHMQLQDEHAQQPQYAAQYAPQEQSWRPIDYRAMQQAAQERPRGRGGAVLGVLILLAVLGVGGYLAWFYGGQPDLASLIPDFMRTTGVEVTENQTPSAETPAAAIATEAATPAAPAVVPTLPPTPAPTPTPYLVEVRQVVMNEQYGVNARDTASAAGTLIRTLDNGTSYYVASGPLTGTASDPWYEIALPEGVRAFVSADYVLVQTSMVPYEEARVALESVGLPTPPPPVVAAPVLTTTAPITAAVQPTVTSPVTTSAALTTAVAVTTAPTVTAPVTSPVVAPVTIASPVITVSATISAPAGLNLRRTAEVTDTNVITQVADQSAVTVIGRSADGEWAQVQLGDGTRGWVSASFLVNAGGLDLIPLGTTQALTPTVPLVAPAVQAPAASTVPEIEPLPAVAVTTTAPVTLTAPATPTTPVTPTEVAGFIVKVTSVLGVNLRPEPTSAAQGTDQLAWNTLATAIAVSADGNWVNVQLDDGRTGWVAASAVKLTPPTP